MKKQLLARKYTFFDLFLGNIDRALKTITVKNLGYRSNPSGDTQDGFMSQKDKKHSAGLMRVNHSGEISAQGLYQGQALTARDPKVAKKMQQSADEENDHLDWCSERLADLGSHTSYMNIAWYTGSLCIGLIAGLAGDKWSLGFVAETERQVVRHIDRHLASLPDGDNRSRKILYQMREDEGHHATVAIEQGAAELPALIKTVMKTVSKVMTQVAYWI